GNFAYLVQLIKNLDPGMQIKEIVHPNSLKGLFIFFSFIFSSLLLKAQTTYIPVGSQEYILLNRMEIKLQKDSIFNFSKTKPFSREAIIPYVEKYYIQQGLDTTSPRFSRVDIYNMRSAIVNSVEWKDSSSSYRSKKPW